MSKIDELAHLEQAAHSTAVTLEINQTPIAEALDMIARVLSDLVDAAHVVVEEYAADLDRLDQLSHLLR